MKTAVITGAIKIIEIATAKKFVENNFNIAICARDMKSLNIVTKQLQKK